jgi:hypothetical protein
LLHADLNYPGLVDVELTELVAKVQTVGVNKEPELAVKLQVLDVAELRQGKFRLVEASVIGFVSCHHLVVVSRILEVDLVLNENDRLRQINSSNFGKVVEIRITRQVATAAGQSQNQVVINELPVVVMIIGLSRIIRLIRLGYFEELALAKIEGAINFKLQKFPRTNPKTFLRTGHIVLVHSRVLSMAV